MLAQNCLALRGKSDKLYDPSHVERSTGKELSNLIVEKLKKLGLNLLDMRGQAYDNGANMREPHLVTFLELMSCGFCVVPSLHFLRPQVDSFSKPNCVHLQNVPGDSAYSSGDEGVSGGRPNSRSQGETKIPAKSIWDGEYPVVS
ncbi:hypothetical protein TNCV_2156011 [Trichonephila clavipes]|nr:hypothetical protein TNCV_2156011 [Trichonephila clavipes]